MFFAVFSEALATDAAVGLHLDRDNRQFVGDQEVHLCLVSMQRPIAGYIEALCQQGGQHIILGEGLPVIPTIRRLALVVSRPIITPIFPRVMGINLIVFTFCP